MTWPELFVAVLERWGYPGLVVLIAVVAVSGVITVVWKYGAHSKRATQAVEAVGRVIADDVKPLLHAQTQELAHVAALHAAQSEILRALSDGNARSLERLTREIAHLAEGVRDADRQRAENTTEILRTLHTNNLTLIQTVQALTRPSG